jgi:hypothetical protein
MQSSSTLGSPTAGSCSSTASSPPQEQTKGGNTASTVPAHETVATKSTRAVAAQATAVTVWRTLHPKITSRSWAASWATGGHHSIHGGHTKKNPCIRRRKKGSLAVEPLTRGTADLSITDRSATPYHRVDPPSPTPDEANPNPNGSGFDSPPRLSPLGNRIICWVIRLPTSTRTRPVAGHSGAFTDVCPSNSTVR